MTCTGLDSNATAIYTLPCLNPDATPTRTRSGNG